MTSLVRAAKRCERREDAARVGAVLGGDGNDRPSAGGYRNLRIDRVEDGLDFIVKEYPSLPQSFREYLNGYINGVLELAGINDANVTRDDSDPMAWRWRLA